MLERAKELDVPKEILDRNIKKASEKGQEAYIEKVYEVGNLVAVSSAICNAFYFISKTLFC